MAENKIDLVVDSSPLLGFLRLLEFRCEAGDCSFSLGELRSESFRVESVIDAANAGKIFITLYPSDAFLGCVAAALAGDGDLKRVQ